MTLGGLFSVESAAQAMFWVVVGLTLAGAVIAVGSYSMIAKRVLLLIPEFQPLAEIRIMINKKDT